MGSLRDLFFPKPPEDDARQQGRTEMLGQGLTAGFGDEIGAQFQEDFGSMGAALDGRYKDIKPASIARAAFPVLGSLFTGSGDPQALKENRDIIARQRAAEPKRSGIIEAIGSLALPIPAGGAIVKGGSTLSRVGGSALRNAGMGMAYGAGNSNEQAGSEAWAKDVAGAGGIAGLLGPLFQGAAGLVGKGVSALGQKLGAKVDDVLPALAEKAKFGAADAAEAAEIRALQSGDQQALASARAARRALDNQRATAADPWANSREVSLRRADAQQKTYFDDLVANNKSVPKHDIVDPSTGALRQGAASGLPVITPQIPVGQAPQGPGALTRELEGMFEGTANIRAPRAATVTRPDADLADTALSALEPTLRRRRY